MGHLRARFELSDLELPCIPIFSEIRALLNIRPQCPPLKPNARSYGAFTCQIRTQRPRISLYTNFQRNPNTLNFRPQCQQSYMHGLSACQHGHPLAGPTTGPAEKFRPEWTSGNLIFNLGSQFQGNRSTSIPLAVWVPRRDMYDHNIKILQKSIYRFGGATKGETTLEPLYYDCSFLSSCILRSYVCIAEA